MFPSLLTAARRALAVALALTTLPLLAKGFFTTPEDLRTARECGADAALLLLPYLLWSPVGTLVTWQMQRLNR